MNKLNAIVILLTLSAASTVFADPIPKLEGSTIVCTGSIVEMVQRKNGQMNDVGGTETKNVVVTGNENTVTGEFELHAKTKGKGVRKFNVGLNYFPAAGEMEPTLSLYTQVGGIEIKTEARNQVNLKIGQLNVECKPQ